MGERRSTHRWEDLMKGKHLKDPGVDGRVILKWTYKNWDGGARAGSIWPRIRTGGAVVTTVINLWVP
jgi:hypothetical protein